MDFKDPNRWPVTHRSWMCNYVLKELHLFRLSILVSNCVTQKCSTNYLSEWIATRRCGALWFTSVTSHHNRVTCIIAFTQLNPLAYASVCSHPYDVMPPAKNSHVATFRCVQMSFAHCDFSCHVSTFNVTKYSTNAEMWNQDFTVFTGCIAYF